MTLKRKTKRLIASVAAVALLSIAIVGGSTPSASASNPCPKDSGFMGRDVLDVQTWGNQIIPPGNYPDYSQYPNELYSYGPCQWQDEKYLELRQDLVYSYRYVQLSVQASNNTRSEAAKEYYQYLAKREMTEVLGSAMADWIKNTEPSAAQAILEELWEKELTHRYVAQIFHQLTWHYTFMGEKEGLIGEVYDTLAIVRKLQTAPGRVKAYADSYQEGSQKFQQYKVSQVAKAGGLPPLSPRMWIVAYVELLYASEDIIYPTYNQLNRTAIQASWMALLGEG